MTSGPLHTDAGRTLAAELSACGTLTIPAALSLVRELATQLGDLHAQGVVHGAISAAAIRYDHPEAPSLVSPAAGTILNLDEDWSGLLPDLSRLPAIALPTTIEILAREFKSAGVDFDPPQIDICQLGAVWCRALTGEPPAAYLRSPRVTGRVPAELRVVLERTLGANGRARFANAYELALELRSLAGQFAAPPTIRADQNPVAASDAATPMPKSESDTTPSFVSSANPADDTSLHNTPRREVAASSAPSASSDPGLPFARLGHYEIVRKIGHGGMGDVYLGYEASLDRQVAIKVLPADLARSDDFVRRFRTEATAVAKLNHPNIVPIYLISEDQGHHFYVMQFIDGESLAELLARKGPLAVDEVLLIVGQVLGGLAAAHQLGMVHRDIKPGNILLDRPGRRALLADFGLVKSLESSVTGHTATGVVMGTVDYISPEQGRGLAVDARSDLYSMGVLLFRMLSGRLPFSADSPTALIFQHVYEPPPSLQAAAAGVSAALAAVVAKLLAKSPADRHQSAEELLADLRALRAGQPLPGGVERTAASADALHQSSPGDDFRNTTIIAAPRLDEEPGLSPELFEIQSLGWWDRTCDRALSLFRRHAPEVLQQLQNTSQQVDAAVAVQSRRKQELERLTAEAQSVLDELQRAAKVQLEAAGEAHRRAAATNDPVSAGAAENEERSCREAAELLERQAADQEEQLELIRLRLANVAAVMQRLQNQRDIFAARLKVAGVGRSGRPRGLRKREVAAILAALVVFLVVGNYYSWQMGDRSHSDPAATITRSESDSPSSGQRPAVTSALASDEVPLTHEAPLLTLMGHHRRVHTVAFHPDGNLLASGAGDSTAIVWDLGTGRPVHTDREHVNGVSAVAFSPDGALLATGGGSAGVKNKTLTLWSTSDWSPITAGRGTTQLVSRIEFAGSKSIAALIHDGAGVDLRLLDAVSGDEIGSIKIAGLQISAFAVHPSGLEVAIGGSDGLIRVWDVQRGEQSRVFNGRHQGAVGTLAYNALEGRHVISMNRESLGRENSELKVWDSTTGVLVGETILPRGGHRVLAFAPDGKRFAVGSGNRLLLGETHSLRLTKAFPMKSIQCLAFSPDGSKIAAGGGGSEYNVNTEAELVIWNAQLTPADTLLDLLKKNGGDLPRTLAEVRPGWRRTGRLEFDEQITVTDAGLRELAGLTGLKMLLLGKMPVTEAGLRHLAPLKKLRELNLAGTSVSDAAGAELQALTGLEVLNLSRTAVSDGTVEYLKALPFLRELDLSETKISDLAVEALAEMTDLKKLLIVRTKMTAGAVEKLRKALPGCEVKW